VRHEVNLNWLCLSFATALLCVASAGLGACGGQAEKVKSPAPVKMVWGGSDAPPKADEQPAEPAEATATVDVEEPAPAKPLVAEPAPAKPVTPDPSEARPGDIDLDAVASTGERPAVAPAPKSEPEPERKAATSASSDPLAVELQRRRNEKERKAASGKKPRPQKPATEVAAESAAPRYTGSDPCKAPSFSVPRVGEACATGGRSAAKRVMKDAIGKATATGQTLKCTNCHANQRDYSLKSNAVADLKRWLDN
jgi:hypothetical protein